VALVELLESSLDDELSLSRAAAGRLPSGPTRTAGTSLGERTFEDALSSVA